MTKAAATDPRIDAYIAKSPAFAQPILTEVRARMHRIAPGAAETIKWNAPFFLHDGKLLVSMAGFKAHAKVLVWLGEKPVSVDVKSLDDLPSAAVFAQQVKDAIAFLDGANAKAKPLPTKGVKPVAGAAPAKKKSSAAADAAEKAPASSRPAKKSEAAPASIRSPKSKKAEAAPASIRAAANPKAAPAATPKKAAGSKPKK
jgi:hypothetical protein